MDKQILASLPTTSGVYQFLNTNQQVLYVGKAKNIRKRVGQYFLTNLAPKTQLLMQQACAIKPIVTNSENEALLLENTLIKKLKPRYNILFKDDKSYPYLLISEHKFPRLILYRGNQTQAGNYYGPYPNSTAARETLELLLKIFKIRNCNDNYFRNRSRPCVQYQIQRCSAPCVGYIEQAEYKNNIDLIKQFFLGKNRQIIQHLKNKMMKTAAALNYEQASVYRNQLASLEKIFQQQYVTNKKGNVDVIAIIKGEVFFAIQLLFIRNGKVNGSRVFIKSDRTTDLLTQTLACFIIQHYLSFPRQSIVPKKILTNIKLTDGEWISNALSEYFGKKISINTPIRGVNRAWIKLALTNAEHAIDSHSISHNNYLAAFEAVRKIFKLAISPKQVECFDISHTMGIATIASCVVFTQNGALKSEYRRFRIEHVAKSSDCGAIMQALQRRYAQHQYPDLLIIDGGKAQLNAAIKVVGKQTVPILAIAKGRARKPGLELIHATTLDKPLRLPSDSTALHLLQQIRDEAHRFAITGHRQVRTKLTISSVLESIPGIGPKRRQAIIKYFGGLQRLKRAEVEEIAQVPGINQALAQVIHEILQENYQEENR